MTGVHHWRSHAIQADHYEAWDFDVDYSGINFGLFSVCPDETETWKCAWIYEANPRGSSIYPFSPDDFTAEDFEKGRDAVF